MLLNERFAKQLGATLLVRIEDIDTTRCSAELITACLEDLNWLGIAYEPAVRIQSRHFTDYTKALDALMAEGLLYPCFCTRAEIAKNSMLFDPENAPLYAGTCKRLTPHQVAERMMVRTPFCLRLKMNDALSTLDAPLTYTRFDAEMKTEPVNCDARSWGDVVLMRKETPTSYHLSVVVDDAMQGITHIVRGKDLEAATDIHVLLQRLLDLNTPLYHHHELLKDEVGHKLSKSAFSESLDALRTCGITAQQVREMLGF